MRLVGQVVSLRQAMAPRGLAAILASATAQPLAGTARATYPFRAFTRRGFGSFAHGALKRLDIGSGSLAPERAWKADDIILFTPNNDTFIIP